MVELKTQKRIAAEVLKCSKKRVVFDSDRLTDIKEAITKGDIKSLIKEGVIKRVPIKSISKVRARKIHTQKVKGRKKGVGKRKGRINARTPKKRRWINSIRLQRLFLKELKGKGYLSKENYRKLYTRSKSGFFRNKRHLKMYIEENKLAKKK